MITCFVIRLETRGRLRDRWCIQGLEFFQNCRLPRHTRRHLPPQIPQLTCKPLYLRDIVGLGVLSRGCRRTQARGAFWC